MRKLNMPETMPDFNEPQAGKTFASKTTIVFISIFLVAVVVFLVTVLSLTHGLTECRTAGYSDYMGFFVNYHAALMIILVAAAAIFGGAIYRSLKENVE